jgi:hypothetical protein
MKVAGKFIKDAPSIAVAHRLRLLREGRRFFEFQLIKSAKPELLQQKNSSKRHF